MNKLSGTIYVLDDDASICAVLKLQLTGKGYNVSTFSESEKFYDAVGVNIPDLILLDVNLGDITGYDVCEKIKKKPEFQKIPVIFITALSMEQTINRCFECGGSDYVNKPINIKELLIRINFHLDAYRKTIELDNSRNLIFQNQIRLHTLINNSPDIINFKDKNGKYVLTNNMFQNLLGREIRLIDKSVNDIIDSVTNESLRNFLKDSQEYDIKLLNDGKILRYTDSFTNDNNEKKYFDMIKVKLCNMDEEVCGVVTYGRDITQQKKLHDHVVQIEKLSSVGQLVAGLCHEFNNILAVVKMKFAMMSMDYEMGNFESEEIKSGFSVIDEKLDKMVKILNNLVDYAKPKKNYGEIADINFIIKKSVDFYKKQFELEGISISTNLISSAKTFIDPAQFEQVILNMVINAKHAIMPKKKGTISIESFDENNCVNIRISDTGIGIEPDNFKKIFEPFFTTKGALSKGELKLPGTGLGLSVCYSIIKSYGGYLSLVKSGPDGSQFKIKLPVAEARDEKQDNNEILYSRTIGLNDEKKCAEYRKILIVDDEIMLADEMKKSLNRLGFQNVFTAYNGKDAIQLFEQDEFDVALIDYMMPGMNGEETYNELAKINSKCRFTYVSGNISEEKTGYLQIPLIKKPFDLQEIISFIKS